MERFEDKILPRELEGLTTEEILAKISLQAFLFYQQRTKHECGPGIKECYSCRTFGSKQDWSRAEAALNIRSRVKKINAYTPAM